MDKVVLLVLCCLAMPKSCSSFYPSFRFGQSSSASSVLVSSTTRLPTKALHTEGRTLPRDAGHRSSRHADAIFTNSYRKVLGQISARKFLQTVMGKRLGLEDARNYTKRQLDIYKDTYKQDLTTMLREHIRQWQLDFNRTSSRCFNWICRRNGLAGVSLVRKRS